MEYKNWSIALNLLSKLYFLKFKGHTGHVNGVSFSINGQFVASASED